MILGGIQYDWEFTVVARDPDFSSVTVLCIDGAVADALRESLKDGLKDGSILHWDERSI